MRRYENKINIDIGERVRGYVNWMELAQDEASRPTFLKK
jgi:hypothetical protein